MCRVRTNEGYEAFLIVFDELLVPGAWFNSRLYDRAEAAFVMLSPELTEPHVPAVDHFSFLSRMRHVSLGLTVAFVAQPWS